MGMFDHFPYTNFHELNLDWILQALKEIEKTMDQFVAINSLKYADPIQWSIVRQYEKNTIVIDPLTGTAYISVQAVPSGVALTNEDYWTVVFDLGSFVVRAAKNFTLRWEEATTLTATMPINEGQWVVWGDTLYRALSNIIAGDQYVIDSNIKRITVEEIKDEIYQTFNNIIGDLADLDTTDKSNLVAAINEVLTTLVDTAGDLADLDTTDKSNLVAAINEVLDTLTYTAGDLADLDTTDKSNLVAAINEINLHFLTPEMFGAAGDGITDDTTALQNLFDAMHTTGKHVVATSGKIYLITEPLTIHNDFTNPPTIDFNYSTIKAGEAISAIINIVDHARGGKIVNLRLNCNSQAKGMIINDCMHGEYNSIRISNCADIGIQVLSGYELLFNSIDIWGNSATSVGFEMNTSDSMFNEIVTVNCHYGFSKTNSHNNFSNIHCWIAGTAAPGTITDSAMFVLDGNYCQFNNINIDTFRYGFILDSEPIVNIANVSLFVSTSVTSQFAIFKANTGKDTRSVVIDRVNGYGHSYQFCTVSWLGRASGIQLYGFVDVVYENFVGSVLPDFGENTPIRSNARYDGAICSLNGLIQVDNVTAGTDIVLFTMRDNGLPTYDMLIPVGISTVNWRVQEMTDLYFSQSTGNATLHIPSGYSGTVYITYVLTYPCQNGAFNS